MLLDRALRKHIRLAFQLSIFIQDFQRAKQIIGRIVRERQSVATVIDKAKFSGESIIEIIQSLLLLSDLHRIRFPHLQINQMVDAISQFNHAFHSLQRRSVQIRLNHTAVFTIIHIAINHSIRIILYVGVCGDGGINRFAISKIGQLCFLVLAPDVFYRILKLVSQFQCFNRLNSIIHTMCRAFFCAITQHHLRMVEEIAVDCISIFVFPGVHPLRFNRIRMVTLLQEDNIGNDFRSCICLERIVGQSDSTKQISSFCQIFSNFRILGVHRISAGYKGNYATGTYLIQSFCEEVIVDVEAQLVISAVIYLVLTERNVANGKVIEITTISCFKSSNRNFCLWIKLFCNASADGIKFHTIEF